MLTVSLAKMCQRFIYSHRYACGHSLPKSTYMDVSIVFFFINGVYNWLVIRRTADLGPAVFPLLTVPEHAARTVHIIVKPCTSP